MQIAPGIDSSEWRTLQLDDPDSPDWDRAVEILRTRICGRFTDAADFLIKTEESKPASERRFGFAVIAIDCLLIETLAAFRDGLEDTKGRSKEIFPKFLATRPLFSKHFTQAQAEQFYCEFRNGILHQAEVGGTGKIWSVGELLREDSTKLIVNRTKFHELLKMELREYIMELRDKKNTTLRAKFRKKMDFICRY